MRAGGAVAEGKAIEPPGQERTLPAAGWLAAPAAPPRPAPRARARPAPRPPARASRRDRRSASICWRAQPPQVPKYWQTGAIRSWLGSMMANASARGSPGSATTFTSSPGSVKGTKSGPSGPCARPSPCAPSRLDPDLKLHGSRRSELPRCRCRQQSARASRRTPSSLARRR